MDLSVIGQRITNPSGLGRSGSGESCQFSKIIDYAKCNYALLKNSSFFKDHETNLIFFFVIFTFISILAKYIFTKPWKRKGTYRVSVLQTRLEFLV